MKHKKLFGVASALLTVLGLGITTTVLADPFLNVFAASQGTWTITSVHVPSWGGGSSATGKSNLKKTNSNYASFNADALQNRFGYNVRLCNNQGESKSDYVGLFKNKTTRAGNNGGIKGYHYWADVHSQNFEPSESNVKLHFSADYK